MEEYSETIFDMIQELEEQIEKINLDESNKKQINDIEKIISSKTIEELDTIINKNLEEEIKIKKIAIKLNNYEFEQYQNIEEKLKKELEKLKEKEKQIEEQKQELENKKAQQKLLEYVYNKQIPIEEEKTINEIIEKYEEQNQDPTPILKIIAQENIKTYTQEHKKNKILTIEKMKKLKIDQDDQEMIKKIKEILSNNKIKNEDKTNMLEYLLSLDKKELIETVENSFDYNPSLILCIMKTILEKLEETNNIEGMLFVLNTIYDKYKEITDKKENTESQTETKLIFLSKPTNNDLYIYEDIEKIEDKIYQNILKKQFEELTLGNTKGKSLTGLPENLFEKKKYNIRITYKILPNNYILVLNCYIKGNKVSQNIRKLIEKKNVAYQIHLYEALAANNEQAVRQLFEQEKIKQQEHQNYINNFINKENINILEKFEEGEKKCLKIKK